MKQTIDELKQIIDEYLPELKKVSEENFSRKDRPGKWSRKEILGHLIDSAQNNIRRFIVAQYEQQPKITYNQDQWVMISNYQQYDSADLIQLWLLLNKHIIMILENLSPEMGTRQCLSEDLHTVEWLAQDYNRHLLHHMHQVLDLEPISY